MSGFRVGDRIALYFPHRRGPLPYVITRITPKGVKLRVRSERDGTELDVPWHHARAWTPDVEQRVAEDDIRLEALGCAQRLEEIGKRWRDRVFNAPLAELEPFIAATRRLMGTPGPVRTAASTSGGAALGIEDDDDETT